jgi:hypothetical protein
MLYNIGPWCQSYKTFYGRNLQIFNNKLVFVPGKPFQPSLMFVGKTGAYLRVEHLFFGSALTLGKIR